jgi:hypothetical protein
MNQIIYKIFKGEKSSNVKIPIERDVFDFLDSPVFGINSKIIPERIKRRIDSLKETRDDIHYDIIYELLSDNLGIGPADIEDLTVEDYRGDSITVHVYLQ